jgi:hypothetical protein
MKNIIYFILIIFAASSLLISCGGDSTTTAPQVQEEANKITLNGANYSNVTLTPYRTFGGYLQALNKTAVSFYCKNNSDTVYLVVYSDGQSTGTFQWQSGVYAMLMEYQAGNIYYNGVNTGTTVITAYGSVGQKIEGSFTGRVINSAPPNDTITISCNKFSVTRNLY